MKVISRTVQAPVKVPPKPKPEPETISVNGVVISRDAIARETQNHPAETSGEAWQAASRALVVRELLLQAAQQVAIEPHPIHEEEGRRETDEEACIRALIEQQAPTPKPDEDTLRRVYDRQTDRFRSPDIFAVRHILFADVTNDDDARHKTRSEAQTVLEVLIADPSSFDAMAAMHSACPSKSMGGNLGQISNGQTVPEFEQALPDLPVGHIAEHLVETRYGFHIVCVDRCVAGEQVPFEAVREKILRWLVAKAQHVAIREYIALLAGQAELTGIELEAT